MDKSNPPRTFGVFKPVGHIVLAFAREDELSNAKTRLLSNGLQQTHMVVYSPQEMQSQAETDMEQAGALAKVGQEFNLIRLHHELARKGSHFMVVEIEGDEQIQHVAEVARACGAVIAQDYGRFTIEDLIDPADGKGQVFESPDRGLDSKVT